MADTAKVFEAGVDYRKKFIDKYSRKVDIPSVVFLDSQFHPTLPDHVIVLSAVNIPNKTKVNTLVPMELLDDMEADITENYYNKAKNEYFRENRNGT